ncbi:hypothetical protein B0T26DRAFT_612791, partial [Lasiosphaeria miniovina]
PFLYPLLLFPSTTPLNNHSNTSPPTAACPAHNYTTQLVSLDPLVIYIRSFVSAAESAALIAAGEPLLQPSPITGIGEGQDSTGTSARTSSSAPLPPSADVVRCVLARGAAFLGTLLADGRDDMGTAQLVRYTAGQKYDVHADWFARPRVLAEDAAAGRRRMYNRAATLFVVLQADGVPAGSGETWFPRVRPIHGHASSLGAGDGDGRREWYEHASGGLAFRPVPGNAAFWVNLFPHNGSGDARTVHAGLPIAGGVKTAMNIWPRTFF